MNWAAHQIGSTKYGNLCLTLVTKAYQKGANFNIESLTKFGSFNASTYPQEVWADGFKSGTTGGSNTTPPYGALVFYNASGPEANDPSDYSHVTIMGSGGEMISTNDVVNENAVHRETMAQVAAAHPYNTYVGWWLPDGKPGELAASTSGYSGTQGLHGWRYGFYPAPPKRTFKQMTYRKGPISFAPQSISDVWVENPNLYWTHITKTTQHPESVTDDDGMTPVNQWAVRRWTSSYAGAVTIRGRLAKADPGGGDGVIGRIIVSGRQVWSKSIPFDDTHGVAFSVHVHLSVGSTVDFAVDPKQTDNFDTTTFTATITR